MRPVRLEINGFASFRDHTVVDFTDADYFALVGPTGSGKSTILDAITFALYGTAYRWGRSNAISDALAPTTNRCTVSLTFDVGANRYQVARELRRVGKATSNVSQKEMRLVRFIDPTVAEPDPAGAPPEVLAATKDELKAAILDLLGLDFDDFCQCVVLPQGEFAKFLSAAASERQKILLRLLGAGQYAEIGRRANAIAAEATSALDIYADQLTTYASATGEAEEQARERINTLTTVATQVDDLAPRIATAHTGQSEARGLAHAHRTNLALLGTIEAPDGVSELQRDAHAAANAAGAANKAAAQASAALTAAADAAKAGPQRAPLEQAAERHREHADLELRRGPAETAVSDTAAALADAEKDRHTAAAAAETARGALEVAAGARTEAQTRHSTLHSRHERVSAVRVPTGVADLSRRAAAAATQVTAAAEQETLAKQRHTQAAGAAVAAGNPDTLAQARRELHALRNAQALLEGAHTTMASAQQAAADAAAAERSAHGAHQQALAQLQQARTLAGAAQLRPTLVVGHECPVCTQPVAVLPPNLDDPALSGAEAAERTAQQAWADTAERRRLADTDAGHAERQVATLTERRDQAETRLGSLLPSRPVGDDRDLDADSRYLTEQESTLAALDKARVEAAAAVADAERAHVAAESAAAAINREVDAVRADLHTLCGSLQDLDPPALDVADVEASWNELASWASGRAGDLAGDLSAADQAQKAAEQAHLNASGALRAAVAQHETAQNAYTAAVRAATAATGTRDAVLDRLTQLTDLLSGAPAPDDITELLTECGRLEDAVAHASTAARTAHSDAETARAEQETWASKVTLARAELEAARDRVGALSPPSVGDDLAAGWATLCAWTATKSGELEAAAAAADADAETYTADLSRLGADLTELLAAHDVQPETPATAPAGEVPAQVAAAQRLVAVAVERARGQARTIAENMKAAEQVRTKIEDARERQQVASQLAALLRSTKFPQWLADSALDSLVAGASESLRTLSGGQYDLTHEKGDFYVIDHADADSTRSVKTLSGGETFQASLALALALSDHLSGMGGATKLESIFLDEGFGTLDPDSLEMVAATLENLAQGERTVGVITHVGALAERAPVRFNVRRDSRTSHIEREPA